MWITSEKYLPMGNYHLINNINVVIQYFSYICYKYYWKRPANAG